MKLRNIISGMSAILMLSACSEHMDMQDSVQQQERINIRGEIVQENVTRASDFGFADGDRIGVFIVNREGGKAGALSLTGNHADNVRYTYSDESGLWTASYDLFWKDENTSIDAYSYYPFNGNLSSVEALPITIRSKQQVEYEGQMITGYEASDFLWAKAENVSPGTTINLKHQHIMAGIEVTLTAGEGFTTDKWDALQKTVLIENTRVNTLVNLSKGTVTLADDATQLIVPQQRGSKWRAITAPQTVAAGKGLLNITVDGTNYEFKRSEQTALLPGKLHRFTIKVNRREPSGDYEFSLISEAITPWESDPMSHNGTAREYITIHVEEGEYIGDIVEKMGIDPKEILNLKLTGTIVGSQSFDYIREKMPNLEAIHMKDLRTRDQNTFYWEDGWGDTPYGMKTQNDDYIPKDAFNGLTSMNYVVWPDSLKGISEGAFVSTNLRGSLIFPKGLHYIGGNAFSAYGAARNTPTGELYIPPSVEFIGDGAFQYLCLTGELVLPEHMIYLGNDAFADCEYLTGQIHIPDGLDVLNRAFAPNMTAKVVHIPQGVKKVNGVGGKPSSIIFPEGVTEINSLFGGSSQPWQKLDEERKNLRSVSLPSSLRKLGEWAFAGTGLQSVKIPDGIEFIPYYAFGQCDLQDTLTIPASVLQIYAMAFYDCKMLSAVVLPENLHEIREDAFNNCSSLYYIHCLNPEPPVLNGSAFNGIEKNECAVVVPEGSVDAYRNAEGWKEFKRISAYQNFVCRPMQAKLLNKSNTRTIVLNSDGKWKVSSCPDWIHPSVTSGNKKTELTVKIDELAHGSADREGSIVFTLTDKTDENGNAITCTYDVKQFDYEYDEDDQVQLQKATKGKGINIVFVGDGYDAEDIANGSFLKDMKEGVDYFFGVEPYKTYTEYFNVYADMAMSYESGVCSNVNIWRQTKFSTTYGAGANNRLGIKDTDVFNYVLNDVTSSAITSQNVDQSLIICILNDDAYEGVTAMYSSGAAIAYVPHCRYAYPNDYRGLIQHEAGGHGFGKLGDEYIYHRNNIWTCPCICCGHADQVAADKALGWYRNLSLNGKYKEIDWTHLIFDPRYGDIVDIYEGGYMHGEGIYRSEVNSCMNNNVPYYNTISRQAIVERIMQYAGEKFDFETFVSKDSREMGETFLTRSSGIGNIGTAMHNPMPTFRKGSPLDYLKKKGGKQ